MLSRHQILAVSSSLLHRTRVAPPTNRAWTVSNESVRNPHVSPMNPCQIRV